MPQKGLKMGDGAWGSGKKAFLKSFFPLHQKTVIFQQIKKGWNFEKLHPLTWLKTLICPDRLFRRI